MHGGGGGARFDRELVQNQMQIRQCTPQSEKSASLFSRSDLAGLKNDNEDRQTTVPELNLHSKLHHVYYSDMRSNLKPDPDLLHKGLDRKQISAGGPKKVSESLEQFMENSGNKRKTHHQGNSVLLR